MQDVFTLSDDGKKVYWDRYRDNEPVQSMPTLEVEDGTFPEKLRGKKIIDNNDFIRTTRTRWNAGYYYVAIPIKLIDLFERNIVKKVEYGSNEYYSFIKLEEKLNDSHFDKFDLPSLHNLRNEVKNILHSSITNELSRKEGGVK